MQTISVGEHWSVKHPDITGLPILTVATITPRTVSFTARNPVDGGCDHFGPYLRSEVHFIEAYQLIKK